MHLHVTQVARTYRSNALWHSNEDIWKQRGGTLPDHTPVLPVEPATIASGLPLSGWAPFDRFALEATQGLAVMLNAAVRVKKAVRKLQSHSEASAVDRRKTTSADPMTVTAEALPGASLKTYRIEVDRIAAAPTKEGAELQSSAATEIAIGSNQMKLTMGTRSAPFSIYIVRSDTNRQVLEKLQASIERTGLPVLASLIGKEEQDLVRLQVTGTSTGIGPVFHIMDVYGSAARVSGIGEESQPGTDALYRIDGETYLSPSNQVSLDGGKLSLRLHRSAASPVAVPGASGRSGGRAGASNARDAVQRALRRH